MIKKIALVSGASRGIGRAIALALGEQDYYVIGSATSETGAQSITQGLEAAKIDGHGVVLNIANQESIDIVLEAIQSTHGTPAVLVNNAGITRDNIMLRMKESEWLDVINTNLTGTYRLIRGCLKGMIKQRWGRIVSIGSVSGSMGNPGQAAYAAAKAGLIGFTKSLAREVGIRNVTANVVAPGFVETDMTKDLNAEHREYLIKQIAVARLGQPEDIANAVAFLTSESASYITGETLHVNGGLYMS